MNYRVPDEYPGYHSFLTCQSSVITGMNQGFLKQTGYSEKEIVDKYIDDVLVNLLRIPQNRVKRIKTKGVAECFLFTKALHPRRVCITLVNLGEDDRAVYWFKDKSASCLDDYLLPLEELSEKQNVGCALYAAPDLILLKANPKYLGFLPEPADKAEYSIGKPMGHIFPNFRGSAAESVWNSVMDTGKIKYLKGRRRESMNQVTYWNSCMIPVFRNRKVRYIYEIVMEAADKTVSRQLTDEQADRLEAARQLRLDILESINVGFVILDSNWRFAYANRQAALYLGSKPEKLLDRVVWDCLEWVNETEIEGHLRRAMQENRPASFNFHDQKTDKYYHCNVRPASGGIAVYWVETTSHMHAEREALRNKQRADILYEVAGKLHTSSMPQKIIKQLCVKVSEFLECQLFINYLVDERKKKLRLSTCWGLDEQARRELTWLEIGDGISGRAARDKTRVVAEFIQQSGDKGTEWYKQRGIRAVACHPLIEKDKVVGTLAFGSRSKDSFSRDDLALMKAASDLIATAIYRVRAERMMKKQHQLMLEAERERIAALKKSIQMKDEFLTIISHEFKTPLAVIFSAIQTMEHTCGSELSEKAKGYISKIRQNSFRQLRLVNNLLDITHVSSVWLRHKWSNIDIVMLTRAITESVAIYARQKGITLTFHSKVKQRIIQMDQEKYERILLNLLSNAIKFTPRGKSVAVRVFITNKSGQRMVCIEVKDEGMGIPREKMGAIFERFVQVDSSLTRQAEGVGIGLYLAKKFTESLGGTMSAKSKVGQGSSFSVFFPDIRREEAGCSGQATVRNDHNLFLNASVEFSDMVPEMPEIF